MNAETEEKSNINIACERFKKVHNSGVKKFNKLDEWLDKESTIFEDETKIVKETPIYHKYKRGQLIKVDFGVNIGTEVSHTHFAIVLNNDDTQKNDNITVLPLTSKNGYKRIDLGEIVKSTRNTKKYDNTTYGMVTQIKTISKKRILLNNNKFVCNSNTLQKIDDAIINYLTKI